MRIHGGAKGNGWEELEMGGPGGVNGRCTVRKKVSGKVCRKGSGRQIVSRMNKNSTQQVNAVIITLTRCKEFLPGSALAVAKYEYSGDPVYGG